MERFYLETPSMDRKKDALEYINEFYEYKSSINGVGALHKYMDNYEGWLDKLYIEENSEVTERMVPALTYFLVRESDHKIVGMINIRLALNENLRKLGGHIGYSIRPTERNKGYNKINLYLGLKICDEHGIKEAFLDADLDNPASWRTMEALGGKRVKEYFNEQTQTIIVDYIIDVKNALEKYKEFYDQQPLRK